MSYENNKCPCGGRKLTDTMICVACEKVVVGTFDRVQMDNVLAGFEVRRFAAMRVLAVARRRNPSLPRAFAAR